MPYDPGTIDLFLIVDGNLNTYLFPEQRHCRPRRHNAPGPMWAARSRAA
jgi:hypothetical protein